VVRNPDAVGPKSKRGDDLVGYVKRMPDGTNSHIEEMRTGKNRLAMLSMKKYPAAKNASEAIQTVLLNVRNDGGDVRIVYARLCRWAGGRPTCVASGQSAS
jgi:hypothetical protein